MATKKDKMVKLDPKVARLLDANLNRAREGLRVVEDAARYQWDNSRLTKMIRDIRHRIGKVTEVRYKDLIKYRKSRSDVGRSLVEPGRAAVSDVIAANLRRAQEAARVLEEYSKVFSPLAAVEFKIIRYDLYDVEKECLKFL